jgi:hypothetical protein
MAKSINFRDGGGFLRQSYAVRQALDAGHEIAPNFVGPGSAEQRKERCTASGTR